MSRRSKFLVGAAILVAAVVVLMYTAVRETSSYYMTMEEWARSPGAHAGQPLRLAGRVSDGSVRWDPRTLDLEFLITAIPPRADGRGEPGSGDRAAGDEPVAARASQAGAGGGGAGAAGGRATVGEGAAAIALPVRYKGILPDMFAAGRDVIIEGRVENGVFHAKSLLTTCPSKYEADEQTPERSAARGEAGGRDELARVR